MHRFIGASRVGDNVHYANNQRSIRITSFICAGSRPVELLGLGQMGKFGIGEVACPSGPSVKSRD